MGKGEGAKRRGPMGIWGIILSLGASALVVVAVLERWLKVFGLFSRVGHWFFSDKLTILKTNQELITVEIGNMRSALSSYEVEQRASKLHAAHLQTQIKELEQQKNEQEHAHARAREDDRVRCHEETQALLLRHNADIGALREELDRYRDDLARVIRENEALRRQMATPLAPPFLAPPADPPPPRRPMRKTKGPNGQKDEHHAEPA